MLWIRKRTEIKPVSVIKKKGNGIVNVMRTHTYTYTNTSKFANTHTDRDTYRDARKNESGQCRKRKLRKKERLYRLYEILEALKYGVSLI